MKRFGYRWRALTLGALVAGMVAMHPAGVRAAGTVQLDGGATYPCSPAGLNRAIADAGTGGTVQFTVACSITLASTITLGQNVTIDGNGYAVTISGNNSVQ